MKPNAEISAHLSDSYKSFEFRSSTLFSIHLSFNTVVDNSDMSDNSLNENLPKGRRPNWRARKLASMTPEEVLKYREEESEKRRLRRERKKM